MQNLIERLEKATGPDRGLDCAIAAEFGVMDNFDPSQFIVPVTYRVSPDELRVEAWTEGQTPWMQASRTPRSYTTSIDAALTLVPNGMEWHMSNKGQIGAADRSFAGIYGAPMAGSECDTNAATPAIALCIAALTARANATC